MQRMRPLIVAAASSALAFGLLIATLPVRAASKFQVIYTFHGPDGQDPPAGVIFDAAGNLYGTTSYGGSAFTCDPPSGCGTVFKLTPGSNGTWTETLLRSFNIDDGYSPWAGLVFDSAGNLYGTTVGLGHTNGNVFELMPQANGRWREVVLHAFNGTDGQYPIAPVTLDSEGNVYSTAWYGGYFKGKCSDGGCGTVFKLAKGAEGKWSYATLFAFDMRDGALPITGLIFDAGGSLYSTTSDGSAGGNVFKLTPGAKGEWTERVLGHGAYPNAVIFDGAGNLYGTTFDDGDYSKCENGCGTVFELMPTSKGKWTQKILHTFEVSDGSYPDGGVIFDGAGNLYGTTSGGVAYGHGTVFKLTPHANGKWTHTILHNFNGKDGSYPSGNLLFDPAGSLYGTTALGGKFTGCSNSSGCGEVFKITP